MSLWNQQEKKIQPQDNGRVSCSEVPQLSKLLKHIPNGKKDSVCSYTLCKVRATRCILKGSQCEMLKISLCQSDISRFDNKEPLSSSAETPNQEAMLSLFYPPWAGFLGNQFLQQLSSSNICSWFSIQFHICYYKRRAAGPTVSDHSMSITSLHIIYHSPVLLSSLIFIRKIFMLSFKALTELLNSSLH